MAQPTSRQVHVDRAMTEVTIAYTNAAYIAPQIFPIIPVTNVSNEYYVYTKADWFRDEARPVAPGHGPQEIGYNLSTCPYAVVHWGLRAPVNDADLNNADAPLQLRESAVEQATDGVMLALERRVATMIQTAANWSTTASLSSGSLWSADTSDPFSHITTAKATVRDAIGREPNTIVMGAQVWDQLVKHPDMVDRMKYTVTGGAATPAQVAGLFMINKILIGAAIVNTANEGATASYSSVWGKDFWIGYVNPRPALRQPSAGYIIRFGTRIAGWQRDGLNYRDVYDVIDSTDEAVTGADAGYLIEDAVV